MNKFAPGILVGVAVVSTVGFFWERHLLKHARAELSKAQEENRALSSLRTANEALLRQQRETAAELEKLRASLAKRNPERRSDPASAATAKPASNSAAANSSAQPRARAVVARHAPSEVDAALRTRYSAFFKNRSLDPLQRERLMGLLVTKQQARENAVAAALEQGLDPFRDFAAIQEAIASAEATIDAQIRTEIGVENFGAYQAFDATLPDRNTAEQFTQILRNTGTPLSSDQTEQLMRTLTQTHEAPTAGGMGALLDGNFDRYSRVSESTMAAANSFLSPMQLEALKRFRQRQGVSD